MFAEQNQPGAERVPSRSAALGGKLQMPQASTFGCAAAITAERRPCRTRPRRPAAFHFPQIAHGSAISAAARPHVQALHQVSILCVHGALP